MDRVEVSGQARRPRGPADQTRARRPRSALTALVTDASALLEYLLGTDRSKQIAEVMRREDVDLHVPSLCDVEVASGLRRALVRHAVTEERAGEVLVGYSLLPLTRHGHQPLIARVLELRHNFTAYDAIYVALAERLGAALLTADQSLERSVAAHTALVVLP